MQKTLTSKRHRALIEWLIEARENAGMTQADVAERLGEYQSFMARLEGGQRRVDVAEFLLLAETLGFDAKQMLEKLQRIKEK